MQRIQLTPASFTLMFVAVAANVLGWAAAKMGSFGSSSENVRDFLIGFSCSCMVGSVLLALRRRS